MGRTAAEATSDRIERELESENQKLRSAHKDIIRMYVRMMSDPPDWTNFTADQIKWVREAWYGAATISRRALGEA